MIQQLKRSLLLLLFLGVLFSIPIVAKTFSAHGAIPAVITGVLFIAAILMGPIAFAVAGVIDSDLIFSPSIASDFEILAILSLAVVLIFSWLRVVLRGSAHSLPYLPITGWAVMGALFCVSQVFTHIA